MKLVKNLSSPERRPVFAGGVVNKGWKLVNNGSETWPDNLVLKSKQGNLNILKVLTPLPSLQPEQEVDIKVKI